MYESDNQSGAWWTEQKGNTHCAVSSCVSYLETQNRGLRETTRFLMELASNFSVAGNGPENYAFLGNAAGKRLRYNLISSACDTGASLILQNRTVPICVTTDGDFALSRVAEQWTRAIQGQFYQLNVFDLAADVGQDALQTGTGFVLGYVERAADGRPHPRLERILPNEILVDSVDGLYREPRSIYRQKLISREQLKTLYPKHAAKIMTSGGPSERNYTDFFIRRDNKADFVRVFECWHLPSGRGKRDGRHVICTDNVDLVDEAYERDIFPVIAYRYIERRLGYWGLGLAERVMPAQMCLSEIQQSKRNMQRLCSNAYWMVERNSHVEWEDLTNMPGQMLEYDVTPPQLVVFEGTPADLSQEEAQIKAEVWEQEGFASSVSGGEVNKGLSSARAVRAADDVASRRHVMPTRLYEQLYMQMTRLIADLNDQCAEIDPGYTVTGRYRSGKKSWIKETLWVDLKIPENAAQINVFPISALPTTPQGLWSALEEMTQAGMVGKSQAMELMQMPDVSAFEDLENSNLDLTKYQIDRMLDGIDELPAPYQNIEESAHLVNQCLLVAMRQNAPDEILALFDAYLAHCKNLTAPAPVAMGPAPAALDPAAAAAAQLAAQPMPPPGPMAPPPMPIAA